MRRRLRLGAGSAALVGRTTRAIPSGITQRNSDSAIATGVEACVGDREEGCDEDDVDAQHRQEHELAGARGDREGERTAVPHRRIAVGDPAERAATVDERDCCDDELPGDGTEHDQGDGVGPGREQDRGDVRGRSLHRGSSQDPRSPSRGARVGSRAPGTPARAAIASATHAAIAAGPTPVNDVIAGAARSPTIGRQQTITTVWTPRTRGTGPACPRRATRGRPRSGSPRPPPGASGAEDDQHRELPAPGGPEEARREQPADRAGDPSPGRAPHREHQRAAQSDVPTVGRGRDVSHRGGARARGARSRLPRATRHRRHRVRRPTNRAPPGRPEAGGSRRARWWRRSRVRRPTPRAVPAEGRARARAWWRARVRALPRGVRPDGRGGRHRCGASTGPSTDRTGGTADRGRRRSVVGRTRPEGPPRTIRSPLTQPAVEIEILVRRELDVPAADRAEIGGAKRAEVHGVGGTARRAAAIPRATHPPPVVESACDAGSVRIMARNHGDLRAPRPRRCRAASQQLCASAHVVGRDHTPSVDVAHDLPVGPLSPRFRFPGVPPSALTMTSAGA